MADVPFYMQGSQTGGILQNLPPAGGAPQSYIAPLPGGQTAGYTPGYGQAPMAAPNPLDAGQYSGLTEYEKNKLTSLASGNDYFMKDSFLASIANKGTFNSAPMGGAGAAGNPAAAGTGGTTIGGSDPWLSPDELRAKTNALQSYQGANGSGGGGGGEGALGAPKDEAGGGNAGGGLNLSGAGGNAPVGSTAGQLTQGSTPTGGAPIGYQNPGTAANTNTVGYINPGSTNSGGGAGVLQMNPANAQDALGAYKNTAGYQLLNSPGEFQQSPGYKFAMDQAMGQVQGQASARGMLESGAVIKGMQDRASGLANQEYGNWWNRQNQLYGDYQNRLQGLASGPTGSADAMTAGANSAQSNLQTGSNLGSLFGNQGTAGMGGIINTAAAQSGNMINAGQQQATVNAANQATQLAGATLASNQQQNQNKGLF